MAYFRCGGGGHSDAEYNNLMDQLIEETATGSIASFTDGANNIPAKEIICHINPTETGTGEKSPSNPYVIGGFTEANITHAGVNLWDEQWELGGINSSTGENTPSTNSIRTVGFIPAKPSTVYYMVTPARTYIIYYDVNQNRISSTAIINSATITTPPECYYIRFSMSSTYGATYNNDISINYPSTVTDYKPYITPAVFNVPFGQTVYGGALILQEGQNDKVANPWRRYYFDGSSSTGWTRGNMYGTSRRFNYSTNLFKLNAPVACNYLENIMSGVIPNDSEMIRAHNNDSLFIITIHADRLATDDVSGLMRYFESNPLEFYCEDRVTPDPIILPTKTQINTLLGSNNIYHDCNGDIDVTYRANGALYVQQHPITRGLMAARPTEQIQEQEEQQEEKEINKSEDNEK